MGKKFVVSEKGVIQEGTPSGIANIGQVYSVIILGNNGDVLQCTPAQLQALLGSTETIVTLLVTGTAEFQTTSLFDGVATFIAPSIYSNSTSIQTTGNDFTSAKPLTTEYNNITLNTAGGGAEGVSLGVAVAGKQQVVFNNSPTTIKVYPIIESYIDGVKDTAVLLQIGEKVSFSAIDATHFVSNRVNIVEGIVNVTTLNVSGKSNFSAGLVGTPAITFTGQTNLGFYKISSTQLGVSVGGSLVALFDTNGVTTGQISEIITNAGINIANNIIFSSGQIVKRNAKVGNYTLTVNDYYVPFDTTAAPFTATLPLLSTLTSGQSFIIKDSTGHAALNNLTIATLGGNTIDFSPSKIMNTNFQSVKLIANVVGGNWEVN